MDPCCRQCMNPPSGQSIINRDMFYGPLGAPAKQPRARKFIPKSGKFGRGQIRDFESNDEIVETFIVPTEALKGVKSGDVIMRANPFVQCLSTAHRAKICEFCFGKIKGEKISCVNCGYSYYCDAKCKEGDLIDHEDECYYFKRRKIIPASDTARFILRFLLKMRKNGENYADVLPNHVKRKFADLLDHFDDILNSEGIRSEMIQLYYEEMIKMMGEEDAPNPDYFLECYGRMAINSFHILDQDQEAIGLALYLGPSIMDHSCEPNASVSFEGSKIIVRSLVDHENGLEVDRVRISYIGLMESTRRRREKLKNQYYFECRCSRCLDPDIESEMFSVQCQNCSQIRPFEAESCSGCGYEMSAQSVQKYLDHCEIVEQKMDESQAPSDLVNFCFKLLHQIRVSPFHILMVKTTESAFNNYLAKFEETGVNDGDDDDLEEALFHGLNLVSAYSKYSRSSHVWSHHGDYLLKVAEIEFVLGNNEDCKMHLEKAGDILAICNGKQHQSVQRVQQLLESII